VTDRADLGSGGLRGLFGRLLAATGSGAMRWLAIALDNAALAASVIATALYRDSWRRPVRAAFVHVLHRVAVRAFGTAVATGVLLGATVVTQVLSLLDVTGQSNMVGTIVVLVLVRETTPIVVGLIVFGRIGMATLIDLGEARPHGWLRQLERQGIDPLALLVMPRVLGFSAGAFCLGTVLLASTLVSSYVVASSLGLIGYSIWEFANVVLRAMTIGDFIVPPIKCLSIGFAVGLVCCATALARADDHDELQQLLPRGFVRAALAIILVNGILDLVG
jgi:phospholipid/cholesterol/gamma-HCH transport system permease protein